jgi:hypothetical protein
VYTLFIKIKIFLFGLYDFLNQEVDCTEDDRKNKCLDKGPKLYDYSEIQIVNCLFEDIQDDDIE